MNLPTFENYMDYSSSNYGAHSLRFFDAEGSVFWFSYQTLIAFQKCGGPLIVRQNDWSVTTGKHLNKIDGGNKKTRLPAQAFEAAYARAFGKALAA